MYDIEVIDGSSYAVISVDSPAYAFLKSMNTALLMKKLASEAGQEIFLTKKEIAPLYQGFKIEALERLSRIGLIDYDPMKWVVTPDQDHPDDWFSGTGSYQPVYSFTDFGLEIMAEIKESGEDIEIFLN